MTLESDSRAWQSETNWSTEVKDGQQEKISYKAQTNSSRGSAPTVYNSNSNSKG